jgi:hypothetical protein
MSATVRLLVLDTPFVWIGAHLLQNGLRHHSKSLVWWIVLECMWLIEWAITRCQVAEQQERERAA